MNGSVPTGRNVLGECVVVALARDALVVIVDTGSCTDQDQRANERVLVGQRCMQQHAAPHRVAQIVGSPSRLHDEATGFDELRIVVPALTVPGGIDGRDIKVGRTLAPERTPTAGILSEPVREHEPRRTSAGTQRLVG